MELLSEISQELMVNLVTLYRICTSTDMRENLARSAVPELKVPFRGSVQPSTARIARNSRDNCIISFEK